MKKQLSYFTHEGNTAIDRQSTAETIYKKSMLLNTLVWTSLQIAIMGNPPSNVPDVDFTHFKTDCDVGMGFDPLMAQLMIHANTLELNWFSITALHLALDYFIFKRVRF